MPGQIPAGLSDPAQLNRPLKKRRSPVAWIVGTAAVLGVVGALAGIGYGVYTSLDDRELPQATAPTSYRSATFVETSRAPGLGLDLNYAVTISADAVNRALTVDFDQAGLTGWISDGADWYIEDDANVWHRYPWEETDAAGNADLFAIADGLTIDEVLPRGARKFMTIHDVEREQMFGQSVRKFVTQVDVVKMAAEDPGTLRQFELFWGAGAVDPVPDDRTGPVNITVWVTDDGMVHQVESASDYDTSLYRITFVAFSTDEPYVPDVPSDFVDGD